MSTLNQLKQTESAMINAIRATTAEINQIGKMPLQVALAELQEATAEAKHRMQEAMAILRAAIGDVIESTGDMVSELNADIASLGIPADISNPDEPRQEEETPASTPQDDEVYDNPATNRILPIMRQTMTAHNQPEEVVSRFGEDGKATATLPEPSSNGVHKKKKRK